MIYDADVISHDDVIHESEMLWTEDQERYTACCEFCDDMGLVVDMHGDDDRGYICNRCEIAEQNETYYNERRYW